MKCSICKKEIPAEVRGWKEGHNAEPTNDGRCCKKCNETVVIPARIKQIKRKGHWTNYDPNVKKLRRQGIQVTIKELEKLAKQLDEERIAFNKSTGLKMPITKKWQVNIINKHNTSDEWEFEK